MTGEGKTGLPLAEERLCKKKWWLGRINEMSRWAKYYHQTDFLGQGLSDSLHEKCGMWGLCPCVGEERERDERKIYFYLGRITGHQKSIVSCEDYWFHSMFWWAVILACTQILVRISNNTKIFKKVDAHSSILSSYSNTQYCILIDLLTLLYSHGSGELLKVLKLGLCKNNTPGRSPRFVQTGSTYLTFWHIIW